MEVFTRRDRLKICPLIAKMENWFGVNLNFSVSHTFTGLEPSNCFGHIKMILARLKEVRLTKVSICTEFLQKNSYSLLCIF